MLPPVPENEKGAIRLFVNEYQGMTQPVHIDPEDRMRHAFIMGQTGTGKSTLLERMIVQDIWAGRGVAVIDPHGDMIDNILGRLPRDRAEDIIVFDFLDRERPLGFNILQWRDWVERDLIIDELYRTIDRIYNLKETGGPMFEQHFRNFLKLLMGESKRPGFTPSILDFIRCYTDSSFRRWLLSSTTDREVIDFVTCAEEASGEAVLRNMAPYVTSKFGRFVNDTTLKRIVGQEKSSIDFDEVMNKGKILLVKLGKGRFGSEVSALLANMLVARFKYSAMKRGEMPKSERRDFFLYCDEAHNLPRDNFSELLAEARKYRLGLVMATQYCAQLGSVDGGRGDDLLAAIFGNVGSLITFRSGTQDAEHLARGFKPHFNQLDIISLPNYHGYARMSLNNRSIPPFSFRTELDTTPVDEHLANYILELSRLKFGRDAKIIDAEIKRRATSWEKETENQQ
jgi:type IV secretory pathway TraG/TraD family ATPase VirD4